MSLLAGQEYDNVINERGPRKYKVCWKVMYSNLNLYSQLFLLYSSSSCRDLRWCCVCQDEPPCQSSPQVTLWLERQRSRPQVTMCLEPDDLACNLRCQCVPSQSAKSRGLRWRCAHGNRDLNKYRVDRIGGRVNRVWGEYSKIFKV